MKSLDTPLQPLVVPPLAGAKSPPASSTASSPPVNSAPKERPSFIPASMDPLEKSSSTASPEPVGGADTPEFAKRAAKQDNENMLKTLKGSKKVSYTHTRARTHANTHIIRTHIDTHHALAQSHARTPYQLLAF